MLRRELANIGCEALCIHRKAVQLWVLEHVEH
jgi:hypothetical protein